MPKNCASKRSIPSKEPSPEKIGAARLLRIGIVGVPEGRTAGRILGDCVETLLQKTPEGLGRIGASRKAAADTHDRYVDVFAIQCPLRISVRPVIE